MRHQVAPHSFPRYGLINCIGIYQDGIDLSLPDNVNIATYSICLPSTSHLPDNVNLVTRSIRS
jgi:hypothetical protein